MLFFFWFRRDDISIYPSIYIYICILPRLKGRRTATSTAALSVRVLDQSASTGLCCYQKWAFQPKNFESNACISLQQNNRLFLNGSRYLGDAEPERPPHMIICFPASKLRRGISFEVYLFIIEPNFSRATPPAPTAQPSCVHRPTCFLPYVFRKQ